MPAWALLVSPFELFHRQTHHMYITDPDNNPFSMLVITKSGRLLRVYAPFRAKVTVVTSAFNPGTWVYVEEVNSHVRHKLVYRVHRTWLPFHNFQLPALN